MPQSAFETLIDNYIRDSGLLFLVWGLATIVIGRRPVHRAAWRTRTRAIVGLGLVCLGGLLIASRIVTTVQMGRHGWLFVADRVLIALPVLLIPAVAVLVWTVPALVAAVRRPAEATRRAVFAPRSVVPVQAAFAGALIGFATAFFAALAPPLLVPALVCYGIAAGFAAAAWAWHTRRWSVLDRPRWRWYARALRATAVVATAVVVTAGLMTLAARSSRIPETMSMAEHGTGHAVHTTSVADLTGPRDGEPDRRYTLVAQPARLRLLSGTEVDAWTFNGQVPGPELRVRQGELIEVTIVNNLTESSVSVHWHGVDVPNAEDGVAGVTQDAIAPGGRHVYRFRPDEVGTHWYHSHQQSSVQVKKGLFGALIIDPASGAPSGVDDLFVAHHNWHPDIDSLDSIPAFGLADRLERRAVAAGKRIRVRLLNSDNQTQPFTVTGVPFRVTAVDGNAVNEPAEITGQRLIIGAGGRYDLEFTMPDRPVRLTNVRHLELGVLLSPDGAAAAPAADNPAAEFDPTAYGTPAPTPFGPDSRFDRDHSMVFDNELGFYAGRFTFKWTTNGKVFPKGPNLTVREGELVKLRFANRSHYDHPMHLHGHHVLVLSRNGKAVTGSPLWLDTVNVRVGEVWEVAFRADNPGIWMDHCHILDHAALGMMMHLAYEGVTTPYLVGPGTPNTLE